MASGRDTGGHICHHRRNGTRIGIAGKPVGRAVHVDSSEHALLIVVDGGSDRADTPRQTLR